MSKRILILDELGELNISIFRLVLGLELEQRGNIVQFVYPESQITGNYITSPEKRVSVSDLKKACAAERSDPDVVQRYCAKLDEIVKQREATPKGESFRVERDNGEPYLVFPAINQDIRTIDGVFAQRMSVKNNAIPTEKEWQRKLLEVKPQIVPYLPNEVSDIADDKIAQQRVFEESIPSIPTPTTLGLPKDKEGYTPEEINRQLNEKDMEGPFVVKAAHGWEGTQVYFPETMEDLYETVNHITKTDSVVIQDRIPEKVEGRPQFVRIVVGDGKVLGAIKTTGRKNPFPARPGAITPLSNDSLHAKQEPCIPTPAQAKVALAAASAIDRKAGKKGVYGVDVSTTKNPIVFEINEGPALLSHMLYGQNTVSDVARIFDKSVRQPVVGRYSDKAVNRTLSPGKNICP